MRQTPYCLEFLRFFSQEKQIPRDARNDETLDVTSHTSELT
jgi:hypothetical protein